METPEDIVEEILPMLEPSFRLRLETHTDVGDVQPSTIALGPEEQGIFDRIPLEPVLLDELIPQGSYQ